MSMMMDYPTQEPPTSDDLLHRYGDLMASFFKRPASDFAALKRLEMEARHGLTWVGSWQARLDLKRTCDAVEYRIHLHRKAEGVDRG